MTSAWPRYFRAGAPAVGSYSTSTTARIQGWIQHWNLCTPGESCLIRTVRPGVTVVVAVGARQAGARTNGTVPAGPPTPLRGGTNPPPNAVTSVKVWVSPPAFVARTVCPARTETYPGANCHAGCPMTFAASGENSSPMNSRKGVSCGCGVVAHVPGPMATLNVAGSQLSTIATLASLLLTWAVPTFVPMTHKLTNTASPPAKIANFGMFLSSMIVLSTDPSRTPHSS